MNSFSGVKELVGRLQGHGSPICLLLPVRPGILLVTKPGNAPCLHKLSFLRAQMSPLHLRSFFQGSPSSQSKTGRLGRRLGAAGRRYRNIWHPPMLMNLKLCGPAFVDFNREFTRTSIFDGRSTVASLSLIHLERLK